MHEPEIAEGSFAKRSTRVYTRDRAVCGIVKQFTGRFNLAGILLHVYRLAFVYGADAPQTNANRTCCCPDRRELHQSGANSPGFIAALFRHWSPACIQKESARQSCAAKIGAFLPAAASTSPTCRFTTNCTVPSYARRTRTRAFARSTPPRRWPARVSWRFTRAPTWRPTASAP